ncbi:MAG: sulfite exporter TauE/SafE family protein [Cytophagales bacterium]|nr:sulfite exporter TauE/SafE family protein [Cytophagales bacterium]
MLQHAWIASNILGPISLFAFGFQSNELPYTRQTTCMNLVLFLILLLISEIIGTIGGFGSSVLFVPLAQFFFDFQTVLALTGLLHVFSNTAKLILFYKTINWKLVLWLGTGSIALVVVGAWFTTRIDFIYAKTLLGFFLVAFSIYFLKNPEATLKPTKANLVWSGSLAGFMAGFIGTGGAIRGLALTAFQLPKNFFVGTSAAIDFGVDVARSVMYLNFGFLQNKFIGYIPLLILAAFGGSYLGKIILDKLRQDIFQRIVLYFILAIGLVMLIQEIQHFS